ncbi:tryptophan-rich sensory protein [Cnuibacter sp. UC19_7]|uniref:tryptophan-rich sensory protein n=1 Tax=Cnuibacter sp. UC19_7 TaxID=3350166 RepID=UPI00366D8D46
MRYSNDSVTAADRIRQIGIPVCAALAVAGAFIGSGAAGGTPIAEAAGGALSADSTMVAPAGPAFAIWSVIYLGLIAYAVYQALPGRAADPLLRAIGVPVAASMLLNAAWILSIQFDALWLSVPLIVLLLVSLLWVLGVLRRRRPGAGRSAGPAQALLVDGVFGLYLGWVTIATVANIAAALTAAGFDGLGVAPEGWGIALLVVAGLLGVGLTVWSRGRMAALLSLSWGVAWIGVSRITGTLEAPAVAVSAFAVAGALVVLALVSAVITAVRSARAHQPDGTTSPS